MATLTFYANVAMGSIPVWLALFFGAIYLFRRQSFKRINGWFPVIALAAIRNLGALLCIISKNQEASEKFLPLLEISNNLGVATVAWLYLCFLCRFSSYKNGRLTYPHATPAYQIVMEVYLLASAICTAVRPAQGQYDVIKEYAVDGVVTMIGNILLLCAFFPFIIGAGIIYHRLDHLPQNELRLCSAVAVSEIFMTVRLIHMTMIVAHQAWKNLGLYIGMAVVPEAIAIVILELASFSLHMYHGNDDEIFADIEYQGEVKNVSMNPDVTGRM